MRLRRRTGRSKRRRSVLLALLVAIALADTATLAGAAVLHVRRLERASGTNAVTAPEVVAERREGPFTATIDYAALFSADGHQVSSEVRWADDWFFQDATEYNHDLAHTCAVLSAVANAESAYYQQGSSAPAYAEQAFAELGFEEVSTASYRYRSEVLDEVLGVVDGTDVVAYTLATRHVTNSETGEERLLTVVVVRGSYGSEWLSNARIESAEDATGDGDHLGFTLAAEEIVADLEERTAELDPSVERSYLFCGHSRGAAVASLLASYVDDVPALASAEDVRAYGFATPNCTSSTEARSARYDNIFNVLNPSDVVTSLPPAVWGYDRYGQDVWLPGEGDASLAALLPRMRAAYLETMGVACPADPSDRSVVGELAERLADAAPSLEALASPLTWPDVAAALVDADLPGLLSSHYPNTYIAWLEATDAGDLTFS